MLVLSACGGGSDGSDGSAANRSATPTTAAATGGTVTHIPATPGSSGGVASASASSQPPGGSRVPACPLLVASEASAVIGTPAIVLPSLDPATSVICSWVPRSGGPPSLDVITVATQGTPDYFTFNDLRPTRGLFGERGFVDADRAVFQKSGLYVDITVQAAVGAKQPGTALMTTAAQQVAARLPG